MRRVPREAAIRRVERSVAPFWFFVRQLFLGYDFLVEDLVQLGAGQGAGEPQLASLGVLQVLADLGSGGEVKAGGGDIDGLPEQVQDDVTGAGGHGASGKVTDETAVASLGLVGHDGGDHEVGLLGVLNSEPLPPAKSVSGESSKGGGLQEKTSSKGKGGSGRSEKH